MLYDVRFALFRFDYRKKRAFGRVHHAYLRDAVPEAGDSREIFRQLLALKRTLGMSGINRNTENRVLAEHFHSVLHGGKSGSALGCKLLVSASGEIAEVEHSGFNLSADKLRRSVVGCADEMPVVGAVVLAEVVLR